MNKVVVLGSINRDLLFTVDRLPVPGETVTATGLEVLSGGKGANQAAAAAAIGGSVGLVGRVGADPAGPEQVAALASAGVDVGFVQQDPRAPTGTAVVIVDGAGHNSIVVVPGANGLLDALAVEEAAPLIEGARVLLLQLEVPDAAVERAVSLAGRAGVLTILNIAPYRDLPLASCAALTTCSPTRPRPRPCSGIGWKACRTPGGPLRPCAARAIMGDRHARRAGRRRSRGSGVVPRGRPPGGRRRYDRRGRRVRGCAGGWPGRGDASPCGRPAGQRGGWGKRDPPGGAGAAARRCPGRPGAGDRAGLRSPPDDGPAVRGQASRATEFPGPPAPCLRLRVSVSLAWWLISAAAGVCADSPGKRQTRVLWRAGRLLTCRFPCQTGGRWTLTLAGAVVPIV